MTIQIATTNQISIDGQMTGLSLAQTRNGTIVYTPEGISSKYAEHKMPHARYSTAHDTPASGAAGRAQLEADVRNLLLRLKSYAETEREIDKEHQRQVDHDTQQCAAGNPNWWM